MGISKFTDGECDKLIWKTVWEKVDKQGWSIKGAIEQLSVDADVPEPTLWRCRGQKTKWQPKTRERLLKYAGYNSVNEFKNANAIKKAEEISMTQETSSDAIPHPDAAYDIFLLQEQRITSAWLGQDEGQI
jgi:hypothetical protein